MGKITELFPGVIGTPPIACGSVETPDISPRGRHLTVVLETPREPAVALRQLSDDEAAMMEQELMFADTPGEVQRIHSQYEHEALS